MAPNLRKMETALRGGGQPVPPVILSPSNRGTGAMELNSCGRPKPGPPLEFSECRAGRVDQGVMGTLNLWLGTSLLWQEP